MAESNRPLIRPYVANDLDALYRVCVRTAAEGGDLSGELSDQSLPGHLYAGPYGVLEAEMAFVVEDADGVCGYIVGTRDTAAFESRCEVEWFPELRRRYPRGSGERDADRRFIAQLHDPPSQDPAIVAEYPAHLHIDLLPRVQGRGLGRQLIERFTETARSRGATGVHLGVSARNRNALAFYARVGLGHIRDDGRSVILGRRLTAPGT